MALIKGSKSGAIPGQRAHTLHDLKEQAERVLADARAEARRVVEEARRDAQGQIDAAAQRGFDEGRTRGQAEGYAQGLAEGRAETVESYSAQLAEMLAAWNAALDDWDSRRRAMLAAAREDVLELAVLMGEKIAHRAVELDPTVVVDQVAAAVDLVVGASAVTVSIHPDDRHLIETVLGDLVRRMGRSAHVELRDDAAVTRGGCVLATGSGRIDATVERQVERVVQTLLGRSGLRRDRAGVPVPDPSEQPAAEDGP